MRDKRNIDVLFPMGIVFTGTGVVFLSSVNKAIGLAFMALGITYMIISGLKKAKKKK